MEVDNAEVRVNVIVDVHVDVCVVVSAVALLVTRTLTVGSASPLAACGDRVDCHSAGRSQGCVHA
jgi:hypothetical protein